MSLVSIIIANFNKELYLSETLDSLLDQDHQNWEALIVDDHSQDNSWQIIEKYMQADSRFKGTKRVSEKKGASVCRNEALARAKGDFLMFLDSDDLLRSSCLSGRLRTIEENGIDMAIFPMATFYSIPGDNEHVWRPQKGDHLSQFLSHKLPWTISSPIWKRELIQKLGGFDENYPRLQDVELHTRSLLLAPDYKVFPEAMPDCFYRIDEERKVVDAEQFLLNFIEAIKLYVSSMKGALANNGLQEKIPELKGSLLEAFRVSLYALEKKEISEDLWNEIKKELFNLNSDLNANASVLKLYIKGFRAGLYRIKGFNFLFRKLYL